jgi:catechol 2,3-dioxygenase-like lactoylglutathione lyase family enzyme
MTVRSLDHVYVESPSYDAARAFWGALGFAAESEWGEGGHRACCLVSGTARVVLAESSPGAAPVRPTVHLRVADADAAAKSIAAARAVRVLTPLEPTHWGTRWIRLADPDGNVWVLEETGESG